IVMVGVAYITMQRLVIDVSPEIVQDSSVPTNPVRARAVVRGASPDQLNVGIGPAHQFGSFQGELAVVFSAAMAHLPETVHLISQPPIGHSPRFFAAI